MASRQGVIGGFWWPQGRVKLEVSGGLKAECNWRFLVASRQRVIGGFWWPQGRV